MFLKLYAVALTSFLAIDLVWLTTIAPSFYQKQIGHLMTTKPNLVAAGIFYLIFIAGLVAFVISPALEKKSLVQVVLMGAFFGLVTYATYDLTNLATLREWPLLVTIVDLLWGMTLSASISTITYLIANKYL